MSEDEVARLREALDRFAVGPIVKRLDAYAMDPDDPLHADIHGLLVAFRAALSGVPEGAASLTFAEFAAVNRARCEAPDGFGHPLSGWSLSDWMLAATGEFGEAANVAKKLNRVRDGIPGNTRTPEELAADLADEFADAVIYLDLAAQREGIDLGAAVVSKFNRTSEKIGAPHRLRAAPQPVPEDET